MHRIQPLQDHPEFTVLETPTSREFRVENWRLSRDGSRKVVKFFGWSWLDPLIPVLVAYYWPVLHASRIAAACFALVATIYVYLKCTQVLWESIIAIPSLGIQLETHRGLPSIPLFTSRHFIPLAFLQDFLINEGLRRWDVRYYLVAIAQSQGDTSLHVAYENILPYFPVLLEVYHGIHEIMFAPRVPKGEHRDDVRPP